MKTIYEHIEKLLAQHEYVVVPNLGGFVVQRQSAEITADCIRAPFSTIAFNPLMQHSDGLLAIEIARTQAISYKLAVEIIEKEVAKIRFELEKSTTVQIGKVGLLSQNRLGQLIFTPTKKADFLPFNLGLTNLPLSPINRDNNLETNRISFQLPSPKVVKYVAAAVLLLGLLLISPQVNDVRLINQANLSSILKINQLQKKITIKEPAADLKTNLASTDSLLSSTPIDKSQAMFHVVVASWGSAATAQKYCKELAEASYSDAHVISPVKKYHVAIQSFSDKADAIVFMKELKKTDRKFESAWVLCETATN